MKKIMLFLFFGLISLVANTIDVTVSIVPQKYFIEKIAQDKANVNVMVKPGFSPATYEPQTSQMKLLSQSKVYFSIGVPFESVWLKKFKTANKNMLVVDTSHGIKKIEIAEHEHHEHEEDNHKQELHEEGLDPHIWLDPILVKTQAKTIYEAFVKIDAPNKSFYLKNYKIFLKELDILNKELKNILAPVSKSAFMVFHPSWGYFAKRYDLEQIAVEKEGKEPKPKELVELIKDSKEHNIKIVFVSPQFSQKAANTIARSINGETITLDHLSYEYKENLINTAKVIYNAYK